MQVVIHYKIKQFEVQELTTERCIFFHSALFITNSNIPVHGTEPFWFQSLLIFTRHVLIGSYGAIVNSYVRMAITVNFAKQVIAE